MRALFCRSFILFGIVLSFNLFQPSVSHAGMLGDLWGSIVGFFTGKKSNDPAMEAQITTLLEQTNQTRLTKFFLIRKTCKISTILKIEKRWI